MQKSYILDTRKLLCPLPVIRLQQTIQTKKSKDRITVLASDPGVLYDIPAWCRIHGHTILQIEQTKRDIQIDIEIKSEI